MLIPKDQLRGGRGKQAGSFMENKQDSVAWRGPAVVPYTTSAQEFRKISLKVPLVITTTGLCSSAPKRIPDGSPNASGVSILHVSSSPIDTANHKVIIAAPITFVAVYSGSSLIDF